MAFASVVLEMAVNLGKWRTEMGQAAQISNTRLREIERSAQALDRRFQRLSSSLRSAFAFAGVGLVFREIVKATSEQEAATAQLKATLKSTGNVVGFTSEQLQQMASDLQNVTTYGDEAITGMQSVLATFTAVRGDKFREATEAILDMATKLKIDLKDAAVQVGKALQDPVRGITALRRAGVSFSDDQAKVIKALVETGNAAEAQRLILKELKLEFGGSARAARDTFGGALEGIKNAAGDLLEVQGGLVDATRALNEFASVLADPAIKQDADTLFSGIVVAAAKATKFIGDTANTVKFLAESLAALRAGPALGDLVRIDAQIAQVESLLKTRNIGDRLRFFGKNGLVEWWSDDELRAELARLQSMLKESQLALPTTGVTPAPKLETVTVEATRLPPIDTKEAQKAYDTYLKQQQKFYGDLAAEALQFQSQVATPAEKITADFESMKIEIGKITEVFPALGPMMQEVLARAAVAAEDELGGLKGINAETEHHAELLKAVAAEYAAAITPTQAYVADLERISRLAAEASAQGISIDTDVIVASVKRATDEWRKATNEWTVFADQAAREMQSAFADFLFDPFKNGLKGMLASFIDTVRRMVAEIAAQQILGQFFKWAGAGIASMFGAGSTAGTGSSVSWSNWSGKASGGPVMAGKTYLVGESGPELLRMGGMGGTVIPNAAIGGGGNVSLAYNIDARGADADRIMAILPPLLKQTEQRTIAQVRDLINRGRLTGK